MRRLLLYTSDVGGENEGPACQLSLQHSLHLEDPACWQKQAEQHPSTHPEREETRKSFVKGEGNYWHYACTRYICNASIYNGGNADLLLI